MASYRSLVELANSISQDAAILEEYCKTNGLPAPSLDVGGGSLDHLSDSGAVKAQERLITDTHELRALAMGSFDGIRTLQNQPDIDMVTLSFLTRYEVPKKVPTQGDVSFAALAQDCGVPIAFVKRMLRYAMTNFVFAEKREGFVSHTAMSLLLKEHPFLQTISEIATIERFPGSAKVVDAIVTHPECDEPAQSGWGLANDAARSPFEEMAAMYPARADRFGKAMEAYAAMAKTDMLIENYDWSSLSPGARVVDVGGGKGPVSIDLARSFPHLSFVVQDLPEIVAQGRQQLPKDVTNVTFEAANFFEPQPVYGADVYFLRAVLHNCPDKHCIRILQNLIPALKKGAKVVVHDPYLREGVSGWKNRQALSATLHMMVYFNAHDRDEAEWNYLFAQADPRFEVTSLKKPEDMVESGQASFCILEAVWQG